MTNTKIKSEITCSCGHTFKIAEAKFCRGCRTYNCGCRGLSDPCSCKYTYTLECPSCGNCVCDKLKKWKKEGKLVQIEHERFEFVHKSLIENKYGKLNK